MSTSSLVSGMTARALGFAAGGYLVVLAAGWALSRLTDQSGFGDLAIAALTIAVAAPLGALIGSALAVAPRRRTTVSPRLRSVLVGMAAAVAVVAAGMLIAGNALGITVLLLGDTAMVVVWAAFIDVGATG